MPNFVASLLQYHSKIDISTINAVNVDTAKYAKHGLFNILIKYFNSDISGIIQDYLPLQCQLIIFDPLKYDSYSFVDMTLTIINIILHILMYIVTSSVIICSLSVLEIILVINIYHYFTGYVKFKYGIDTYHKQFVVFYTTLNLSIQCIIDIPIMYMVIIDMNISNIIIYAYFGIYITTLIYKLYVIFQYRISQNVLYIKLNIYYFNFQSICIGLIVPFMLLFHAFLQCEMLPFYLCLCWFYFIVYVLNNIHWHYSRNEDNVLMQTLDQYHIRAFIFFAIHHFVFGSFEFLIYSTNGSILSLSLILAEMMVIFRYYIWNNFINYTFHDNKRDTDKDWYTPWDGDTGKFSHFYRSVIFSMEIVDFIILLSLYNNQQILSIYHFYLLSLCYSMYHQLYSLCIKIHASWTVGPTVDPALVCYFIIWVIKELSIIIGIIMLTGFFQCFLYILLTLSCCWLLSVIKLH